VARRKTSSKPAQTPVAPPPIIGRMQASGMMRFGDGPLPPATIIAAKVRKPTGRKTPATPATSVTPTKSSGMVQMGDMLSQSPENITAMMQNSTGRKPAAKGRRK